MMILVNVFAIASAALFFFRKINPFAFLVSSMLWFILMLIFWILLPQLIYKRSVTFKDRLKVSLTDMEFGIENEKGGRHWDWKEFSTWMESPYFFHLYFNPRSFFIIPKDAFEGEGLNEARNILKAHINR